MAKRAVKTVRVRALVSFDLVEVGDEADLELDERVQGWINAGVAEVVDGGADPAGPSGAEPDDDERVQARADGSLPTGREPGSSFGAGPYGASA